MQNASTEVTSHELNDERNDQKNASQKLKYLNYFTVAMHKG